MNHANFEFIINDEFLQRHKIGYYALLQNIIRASPVEFINTNI